MYTRAHLWTNFIKDTASMKRLCGDASPMTVRDIVGHGVCYHIQEYAFWQTKHTQCFHNCVFMERRPEAIGTGPIASITWKWGYDSRCFPLASDSWNWVIGGNKNTTVASLFVSVWNNQMLQAHSNSEKRIKKNCRNTQFVRAWTVTLTRNKTPLFARHFGWNNPFLICSCWDLTVYDRSSIKTGTKLEIRAKQSANVTGLQCCTRGSEKDRGTTLSVELSKEIMKDFLRRGNQIRWPQPPSFFSRTYMHGRGNRDWTAVSCLNQVTHARICRNCDLFVSGSVL